MDPSTALAVASLAYDVTKDLYDYYRAWKHCDQDVKELRVHLLWLNDAFNMCQGVVGKPDLSADGTRLVCKALGRCTDAISHLRNVLDKIKKEGSPQCLLERFKASTRRACYPFRRETVGGIADQVESCQEGLHFAVNLLHLDTSTEHYHKLQELDEKLVAIDTALKPLPAIWSDIAATKDQTRSVKSNTEAIMDTQRSERERATMKEMMDWLCLVDYSQQQNDLYARRQKDTGSWFLESPEFAAWRKGTTRTLVCPGPPGAGKTIMATTVIHELLQTEDIIDVGIAYLFYNYKRQDEQDSSHLLASIIRQLIYSKVTLSDSIKDIYTRHKARNSRPSREELETAFSLVTAQFAKVYIIVDALDECRSVTQKDIVRSLKKVQACSVARLMVTTRPLPDILLEIPLGTTLEVRASKRDVALYIRARMTELPRCVRQNQDLQEEVVAVIASAVNGMFLLAQLHMDSMRTKRVVKAVKSALQELSHGSDVDVYREVYSAAMQRICSQPPEDATRATEALLWIVRAQRPLKALEFQQALAVETDIGTDKLDEDNILPIEEIISLCSGLITKDERSGTIRLVHYTAQKFLEQDWSKWIPDGEIMIALKCLKYLSFEQFRHGPCPNDKEMAERLADHPLLEYFANHWGSHMMACGRNSVRPNNTLVHHYALSFLRNANLVLTATQVLDLPEYHYSGLADAYPRNTQGAHLVGRSGVETLMKAILEAQLPVECRDSRGCTPLSYAAKCGHKQLVRLLLESDQVDANSQDKYGQTPLSLAVQGGHVTTAKLLINSGQVKVNLTDRGGRTPLSHAARCGHTTIVQLLLGTGQVDMDTKDTGGQPVEQLSPIAAGVAIDMDEGDVEPKAAYEKTTLLRWSYLKQSGRTPLSYGAEQGHEAIVRLLIDTTHVDIDSKDMYSQTPLFYAALHGHGPVVKLLVDTCQVDLNSKNRWGRTPLSKAAQGGHSTIVRLLVHLDQIDVDSKDDCDQTPLSWAATHGNEAVVKLLLDTDQVDIDSKDMYGRTPLSYAAQHGHTTIVQLLESALKLRSDEASVDCSRCFSHN